MGVSLPRLILFDNSHINQRSVRAHNLPLICCRQSDKSASPLAGKREVNCSPPEPSFVIQRLGMRVRGLGGARTAAFLSQPNSGNLHGPVGKHLNSATFLCPCRPPSATCATEISHAGRLAEDVSIGRGSACQNPVQIGIASQRKTRAAASPPSLLSPERLDLFFVIF